jgi:hypothetical protein
VVPLGSRLAQVTSLTSAVWGALALSGAHRVRWGWCLALLFVVSTLSLLGVNELLQRLGLT